MSRYVNRNLKIVSLIGIISSFVWTYLFWDIISNCEIPNERFKYIYLIVLLIVSIVGLINSGKYGRARLRVLEVQSCFYYVLHYFYGVGENDKYKDPFQAFCLSLCFVLLVTLFYYESTIIERGKKMYGSDGSTK